jgi:hypothetical protein
MPLTLGQLDTDGQDYRFAAEMDFGREPATGSASRGTSAVGSGECATGACSIRIGTSYRRRRVG